MIMSILGFEPELVLVSLSSVELTSRPSAAEIWLEERGWDPAGDLCAPRHVAALSTSCTAMFHACAENQLAVCRWLLQNGAATETLRAQASNGETPMSTACYKGFLRVAQWLYAAGAVADVYYRNSVGDTPLASACAQGHLATAHWLYDAGAAGDICAKNSSLMHPMALACYGGHLDVAQWLFHVGAAADVRAAGKGGQTCLHWACVRGHLPVAQWLAEVGADVRAVSAEGLAPFDLALKKMRVPVALWLLQQGAANGESGHVSAEVLARHAPPKAMAALHELLVAAREFHAVVLLRLVLPACRIQGARECPWPRLSGHEATLVQRIMAFVGVVRGRELRYTREALGCFDQDAANRSLARAEAALQAATRQLQI